MLKNSTRIKVRYAETDQMGVVHHANYALYLELARIEWLSVLGFSYADMEKDGVILPVVSLLVNYKRPLFFDQNIQVVCQLRETPTSKITFDYEILDEQGICVATASTVLAFVSQETKRPISCPSALMQVLKGSLSQ